MSIVQRRFPGPVVRWLGGKRRLLGRLLPLLRPPPGGRYVEPMCGGAAAYLALSGELERPALVADANAHLVSCYRHLAEDADRVEAALAGMIERHSRARYLGVRDAWNRGSGDGWWRASALLYLSRAGYGGVWRENRAGRYNVPPRPDRVPPLGRGALAAAGAALARAELRELDVLDALGGCGAGDVAYLDPPYPPGRRGGFASYLAGGFGASDHEALAAAARAAAGRGCRVVVSISDCELARALYGGPDDPAPGVASVIELSAPRSVGARAGGASTARELLVALGPAPERDASA